MSVVAPHATLAKDPAAHRVQSLHDAPLKNLPAAQPVQLAGVPTQAVQLTSQAVHTASVVAPHAELWNVPAAQAEQAGHAPPLR